mmetsp:Transcript_26546/g.53898  ORF Transcript_26546/g.53898 Transcript_26546/m.53898 type:complete len:213 (+) Transcript_26546:3534-4172(+)
MWKKENYDSIYLTGAVLSPDAMAVYSIQHRDGTIEKRSTSDGELLWRFNCSSLPGSHPTCQDSVEAEFSLSSNGNVLYYSDIWGTVVALEVDSTPTSSPTGVPTGLPSMYPTEITDEPSIQPSLVPSLRASEFPSSEPSVWPTPTQSSMPSAPPTDIVAVETVDRLAPPRTPTTDSTVGSPDNKSSGSIATVLKLSQWATCFGVLSSVWFIL